MPDEPIIARLVQPRELQPQQEETVREKREVPYQKAPSIRDKEPPKKWEGVPSKKDSTDTTLGDSYPGGKKKFSREDLLLAERKAIEKVTEDMAKKSSEGKGDDTGSGITFSTKEYKYYGYMIRLKEKIEGIWEYPPDAAARGIYGVVYIRFIILRNGELGEVKLLRTSGYKVLDDAAMKALKEGAPYWPLPEGWKEDSVTIPAQFIYNLEGFYYVR